MSYPMARASNVRDARSVLCFHCRNRITLSRWDNFLGLLHECPWCHRFHGKAWGAAGVWRAIFMSMFGGPFAFLFTARWDNALVFAGCWFAWWIAGAPRYERFTLVIPFLVLFLNLYLVVRHDRDLNGERVYTAIPGA